MVRPLRREILMLPSIQGRGHRRHRSDLDDRVDVIVGLGAAGFVAGPYGYLNSSVSITRGSSVGFDAGFGVLGHGQVCKQESVAMAAGAGVGYQMPQPVTDTINFLLSALHINERIQGRGGSAQPKDAGQHGLVRPVARVVPVMTDNTASRMRPQDLLQLFYLAAAVLLVGIVGLFGYALLFNEVTIFFWMFLAGGLAFRHGFIQYRNRLAMSGTATAKATSAAIGLAELSGRGLGSTREAPITGTPCLFWKVEVQQYQARSNRGWNRKLERSYRVETLELEDDTGRILVWTRGAESSR